MEFSEYIQMIKTQRIRRPVFKIEMLRKEDESVSSTIEDDLSLGSGNLEISLNQGQRRSISFDLINQNNKYTYFFNNMKFGSKFRLYLGFEDDTYGTILFQQGVFIFTDPTLNSELSNETVSITASDKWCLLDGTVGGNLQATYSFEVGTKVSEIIQSLSALDIIDGQIKYNIDPSLANKTLPYTIEKEAGDSISSVLTDIAYCVNAQIYFDEFGILILKPYDYDFVKESVFTFSKRGNDINYISANNNLLYGELYNGVYVIADNYQNSDVPIYAELLNDDISDPNSVPNIGFIKYKQINEDTDGITTKELALERCRYELKIAIAKQSSVSITSLPMYHLDVNQCITIDDESIGAVNQRYIIQSMSIPLGYEGELSLNVAKATN